ncbi:3D domain-containing protein [Prosthecobacter sp.]|uniref:3D domain-containing protein n=1 Tax=Prosthecobacter sp. TaxID=1965333 RepID=UPI002ABA375C|nr:3D domain-containing protein [Prosthecobacter sp.]MDZ4404634.1 3D domain-containing protein [Prosthecobacter sp.]
MYNSRLITSGLCVALATTLSSCALPKQPLLTYWKEMRQKNAAPLETGKQYEVRKALATNIPFRPSEIKSYTFVFEAPKPPLMIASNLHRNSQMRVRTTAYTHDESDHIIYGVKNAIGTNLKFGSVRSAAADWSRFPVGTKFRIAGQPNVVYEVDDYGSALVGTGTIDLYKPSQSMMNDWGVRHVDIEVIQWGSYERSMQLMRDRTKWKHVRSMMEGIEARLRTAGLPEGKHPVTASL